MPRPLGEERPSSALLVGCSRNSVELGLDDLFHLADSAQFRIDVAFFLTVENLLAVQIHFETTIGTWGQRNRNTAAVCPKELVRHPRGGRVMLSSDAVNDVNQCFPFFGHVHPP